MKKRVLIVIKDYYPVPSPSANLIIPLLKELSKECEIKVLTRKADPSLSDKEIIDNIEVIRVRDTYALLDNFILHKKNNSTGMIKKKLFSVIYFLKRICSFILKKFNLKGFSSNRVKKIKKNISEIVEGNKIDYLIPVTFEEIIAANDYKKENEKVRLFPYLLEQFLNETKNNYLAKKSIKGLKKELIFESDKIFVLPTLRGYFQSEEKVTILEHPMIVDNTSERKKKKDKIKVIYAGGLDQVQRNPKVVLEIFKGIVPNDKLEINFYSYGNCDTMLKNFEIENTKFFKRNNPVSNDRAHKLLSESNIILTIGNLSTNVVPSKLFDCISTGNPIIHFYFHNQDPYIEYLKKYRLSLCIKVDPDNILYNSKKIGEFILNNSDSKVMYEEFAQDYIECTPKYVARQLLAKMEE